MASTFDYTAFFTTHLEDAIDFADVVPVETFQVTKFRKPPSAAGTRFPKRPDANEVYALIIEETGLMPVFKISGDIAFANTSPGLVSKNRTEMRATLNDKYVLSLQLSTDDFREVVTNSTMSPTFGCPKR